MTISLNAEPSRTAFEEGLEMFGSPDNAALLDEVVSMAYEESRIAGLSNCCGRYTPGLPASDWK